MQYFKNVELSKLYPVSEAAVRKWIEAARIGKLDLQLHEHNGRAHIANTAKNLRLIDELVARGKKYKNTRSHKIVAPTPEFYSLYDQKQVLDIIANLRTHRELPLQYSYFDGGVEYWDTYAQRLWREEGQNTLNATVDLLSANFGNLDSLLENYEKVNVIDLGVGNALPVKELLTFLLYDRAVLGRYIGIDISSDMLKVAERNIAKWFDSQIDFEGHARDITYQRFDDILVNEEPESTLNLVLLLGGTLNNLRSPNDALRTIYNSMGRDDVFVLATKLDSSAARRYFDFHTEDNVPRLAKNHRLLLDLLNIDESFYEVEQFFDEVQKARVIQVRLKVDLTINFAFDAYQRQVALHKGETLLLWRAWHHTAMSAIHQLHDNGLALLQASTTRDRHYLMLMSEVESASHN